MLWAAAFFFVLFIVRVLIDPRVMRAGVYLMVALTFLAGEAFLQVLTVFSARDSGAYALVAGLGLGVVFVLVLVVMLILNGVTMLRREGRRLPNMLSLGVGILFGAEIIWAVATLFVGSYVMLFWTMTIFVPTAYVSFGFLSYVVYSGLYQWGTRLLGGPVGTVVVLGSGLIDGQVPPLLASRLNRGRAVMASSQAKGKSPVIVVSGGKGSDETRPEAAAMAEYLVKSGVEPSRIIEEDRSRNTEENLANTELVLSSRGISGRVAVVTNNFHAFRSALLMRQAKMKGYVIGAPTARYYWPSASIREFVAIIRDHPWFTIVTLGVTWLPLVAMTLYVTLNPPT
ncbi:MAG: YdcF family protein [Propionibacteriaceae bacterium]|nr:YdcF family protein [Propionibacteriaceae bacterium]